MATASPGGMILDLDPPFPTRPGTGEGGRQDDSGLPRVPHPQALLPLHRRSHRDRRRRSRRTLHEAAQRSGEYWLRHPLAEPTYPIDDDASA